MQTKPDGRIPGPFSFSQDVSYHVVPGHRGSSQPSWLNAIDSSHFRFKDLANGTLKAINDCIHHILWQGVSQVNGAPSEEVFPLAWPACFACTISLVQAAASPVKGSQATEIGTPPPPVYLESQCGQYSARQIGLV